MNGCICGCVDEMERKVKPQTKQTQSNHTDINQINPVSQHTQTYTDSNDNETDNNNTQTKHYLPDSQPNMSTNRPIQTHTMWMERNG